jgi:hypothetical protein
MLFQYYRRSFRPRIPSIHFFGFGLSFDEKIRIRAGSKKQSIAAKRKIAVSGGFLF